MDRGCWIEVDSLVGVVEEMNLNPLYRVLALVGLGLLLFTHAFWSLWDLLSITNALEELRRGKWW